MASEREIAVTISAYDQFTSTLEKFQSSVNETFDTAVGKAGEMEEGFNATGRATEFLKEKWLELAGAYLSVEFLLDARKDALEAESSLNKLRMSVENLGLSWEDQGHAVEETLKATSEYAVVTEADASKSLQTLIFHSGKYRESLENLNLVYDLAYMKGIDQHEAAMMVGKAMTGNVSLLGRYIPELHDLKNTLGDNATQAEKSAYALMLLKEKTQDAMERMTEHEKIAREEAKAMEEFKEAVGGVVLTIEQYAVAAIDSLAAAVLYAFAAWEKFMAALSDAKAWVSHNSAAASAAAAHRAMADAALKDADALGTQAGRLEGLTEATQSHTAAVEQHAAAYARSVKAKHDAEDAAAEVEKERQAQIDKENKLYEESEKKINAVILATIKLGASKEALRQIEVAQFAATGADADQVARYTDALEKQAQKENELAVAKQHEADVEAAKGKLKQLDEQNPYNSQAEEAARNNQLVKIQKDYQTRLQYLQNYNAEVIANMKASGASQDEIERKKTELAIGYAKAERDAKLAYASDAFGAASNLMQNLYVLTGSHNKTMFEAMKAFAISQTIIDTYRGAQAAYAALAGIPIVGPELGLAAAAAAIVAGMVRVQQIAAQQPGGSQSISAGGQANPAYSGGSTTAYPVPQTLTNQQQTSGPTHVTVVINNPLSTQNWDAITQNEIVPALNRAGDRNIQLNTNVIMNAGY